MDAVATLAPMARQRKTPGTQPTGGQHKTARSPIQLPAAWDDIAQQRATQLKQPKLWYLIWLIEQDAIANGFTGVPAGPWDKKGKRSPGSSAT
jgi:hypothetical protein